VVSTGGGIVLDERNWSRLRALGPVVCLTAGVEAILQRVGKAADRPLLAGEPGEVRLRVETLLARRREAYRRADWTCPTEGKTPAEIAEQIIRHFQLKPKI
jgi:shikimate kinase